MDVSMATTAVQLTYSQSYGICLFYRPVSAELPHPDHTGLVRSHHICAFCR